MEITYQRFIVKVESLFSSHGGGCGGDIVKDYPCLPSKLQTFTSHDLYHSTILTEYPRASKLVVITECLARYMWRVFLSVVLSIFSFRLLM